MRKFFVLTIVFVVASLLAACGLNEAEVSQIAAQAAENAVAGIPTPQPVDNLTEGEVSAIAAEAAAEAIASIPTPESPDALTQDEVAELIAQALAEVRVDADKTENSQVIPLEWFSENGIEFEAGVTVSWECEIGARAWQGYIPAMTVPEILVIRMDHECEEFQPGLEYPGGIGTIWFQIPIEGTLGQKGDCPCVDGDC